MRVLIVEDGPALARSLAATLREENYAVDLASDGEIGLTKAREQPYDAILLDVMLPRLVGWEVLARLRPDVRTPRACSVREQSSRCASPRDRCIGHLAHSPSTHHDKRKP